MPGFIIYIYIHSVTSLSPCVFPHSIPPSIYGFPHFVSAPPPHPLNPPSQLIHAPLFHPASHSAMENFATDAVLKLCRYNATGITHVMCFPYVQPRVIPYLKSTADREKCVLHAAHANIHSVQHESAAPLNDASDLHSSHNRPPEHLLENCTTRSHLLPATSCHSQRPALPSIKSSLMHSLTPCVPPTPCTQNPCVNQTLCMHIF